MKRHACVWLLGVCMLWGCLVVPGPRGTAVVVPALPTIVELDVEPYYFYSGYYYYYNNDHWFYGHAKNGPWVELPRGHYPKETKWKGKGRGRGH